jgi:molybdopterin converting factor small subunit
MNTKEEILSNGLRNIKAKATKYAKLKGCKVMLFATFFSAGKKLDAIADKVSPDKLTGLVTNYLKLQPLPVDSICIDFFGGEEENTPFDSKTIELNEVKNIPDLQFERSSFHGLGEAEITAMVDRKWQEKVREQQFAELQELVKEQELELKEAENTIEKLTETVDDLTEQLNIKKSIHYYAKFAGEFLEGLGIKKSDISKKLGGLMGMNPQEEENEKNEKGTDSSCIVDEPTIQNIDVNEKKRLALIELIHEFLKTLSVKILSEIYDILSDIEQDKSLAGKLMEYIILLKTQDNANAPANDTD